MGRDTQIRDAVHSEGGIKSSKRAASGNEGEV